MRLAGSVILITGGTGSFGSRVAQHLRSHRPAEIRVFSRDEKKQAEMRAAHPGFRYLLGDVRDPERLREAMHGVDVVFHAAALKQVPSCEDHPYEAVKTNVVGTQNACDAARERGVRVFVALSTDKAVKPVNAMGMSKAMMERIVCSQNRYPGTATRFCCVRYGNVLGSRGSVVPLFLRQIARDEPLTLTVPGMTRFLLTLDQSVALVLHAIAQARGGEIFVRKAPACTVRALADAVRVKFSPRGARHPMRVTGIRPGEKIHEILVNEYEMRRAVASRDVITIEPEYRAPRRPLPARLGAEYTSANTQRLSGRAPIGRLLDAMGPSDPYE